MKKRRTRPVWVSPWDYTEGWIFAGGLLITGLALQIATGGLPRTALAWPVNLYVGLGLTAAIVAGWVWFRRNNLVNWLSRVPAAITSIALITFLVLIMGFTLQEDAQNPVWVQKLGLSNMTSSWPFLLGLVFFLGALGMATMKRLTPFKGRNIGFFLNHAGLYIIVLGGMLGAADLRRYTMHLQEGSIVWVAQNDHGHFVEMPLALELKSFNKEEYHPKITIINPVDNRIVPEAIPDMFEIDTGRRGNMLGFDVEIKSFMMLASFIEDRFEPVNNFGAAPAAFVEVTLPNGTTREGWISSGSFMMPHKFLEINRMYSLAMTIPKASHYSSDVIIYTRSGEVYDQRIEVNHPVSAEGWKLYQYSYDDRFGRWSPTSVIEAIRDPWLPVVYTGIFMMLAGSIYLMFQGKSPDKPEEALA